MSLRLELLKYLCQQRLIVTLIMILSIVGLLFTILSVLALEPGSSSHTIAVLNLPGFVGMVGWTSYTLYRCQTVSPAVET